MEALEVGFSESDIACTVVLLKAMVASGAIDTPLAVELCPAGLEGPGWRRAAEEHLEEQYRNRRAPMRTRQKDPTDWEEMAERELYERRKQN